MPLRWYQKEAVDSVFKKCREDKNANPLIVAPTGAGKSHIISGIIEESLAKYGDIHFIVLAHRKELLVQNERKLPRHFNTGFYCAGLGRKQVAQITFASIGSVYKDADKFSRVKVIIVDECHLIPNKKETGMYRRFLNDMQMLNGARVIGLTATPYRLDSGRVYGKERLFKEITYDCDIIKLTEEGFLSEIVGKEALSHVDTSKIKLRGGEFISSESESIFMQLIESQCREIINFGADRKRWLIFCSGIKHAQAVAEIMQNNGIKADSLTGANNKTQRAEVLRKFDAGELQCVSNCDVLTTGFDQPDIDLLALLRPTQSTGLYVQMVGRGLRIAEGKDNCLLLDFGENVKRHGLITDIKSTSGGSSKDKEKVIPVKTCPVSTCRAVNSINAEFCTTCNTEFKRECPHCNYPMPISIFKNSLECQNCGELLIMRDIGKARSAEYAKTGWQGVREIYFNEHFKIGSPSSMKISYHLANGEVVYKYVCVEHEGGALYHAKKWCQQNIKPEHYNLLKDIRGTKHIIQLANSGVFKRPTEVLVSQQGKWLQISKYNYGEAMRLQA